MKHCFNATKNKRELNNSHPNDELANYGARLRAKAIAENKMYLYTYIETYMYMHSL